MYADSDYASKATDRQSVSGGAIVCGGAPVAWLSRSQKCITFSTSEAEYVAMGDCVKGALFVRLIRCFLFPEIV